MRHTIALPSLALALCATACHQNAAPAATTAAPTAAAPHAPTALAMTTTPTAAEDPVLATVNGHPITMADVHLALRLKTFDEPVPPEKLGPVLDGLIRQELTAQAAEKAGLDQVPKYRADYAKAAAPLEVFRRRVLGDAWFAQEVAAKVTIPETEVQQYFDDHKALFSSEFRVGQILTRDEAKAKAALATLAAGKSFDEVARAELGPAAGEGKPWELNWMPWQLLPQPWHTPLQTLKPGDVSPLIAGPSKRFWVIKLLDKRPAAGVTLESVRPAITEYLRNAAIEAKRGTSADELIAGAHIVRRLPPPTAPAAAPTPAE